MKVRAHSSSVGLFLAHVAVISWIVVQYAFHWSHIQGNEIFLAPDEDMHMNNALDWALSVKRWVSADLKGPFEAIGCHNLFSYFPPLMYVTSASCALIFGLSHAALVLPALLYGLLLFAAVYAIGVRVRDRWIGVMAVFVMSLYPAIYGLCRAYGVNIALLAFVSIAIWILLRPGALDHVWVPVALGGICALGLLANRAAVFAVFLLGPLTWVLCKDPMPDVSVVEAYTGRPAFGKRVYGCWVIAMLVLAVAGPHLIHWFVRYWSWFSSGVVDVSAHPGEVGLPFYQRFIYYPAALIQLHITPWLAVLSVICLCGLRRRDRSMMIVLVWIATPWAILSVMAKSVSLYCLPIVPAIAVLTALGWSGLRSRLLRVSVVVLLVLMGVPQFLTNSGYQLPGRIGVLQHHIVSNSSWVVDKIESRVRFGLAVEHRLAYPPRKHSGIVQVAAELASTAHERPLKIGLLSSHDFLQGHIVRYWTVLNDPSVQFDHLDQFSLLQMVDSFAEYDRFFYVAERGADQPFPGLVDVLSIEEEYRALGLSFPETYVEQRSQFLTRVFDERYLDSELVIPEFDTVMQLYCPGVIKPGDTLRLELQASRLLGISSRQLSQSTETQKAVKQASFGIPS